MNAQAGRAFTQIQTIIRRYKVRTEFPPEVLRDVETLSNRHETVDPNLDDLSELPFVTIDNPDSKDLDQALYIEGDEGPGCYRIYYALADGSFFAPPGSAVFAEALRRGVTQYFPGFSHPMLPRRLSEDLVSLNPDVERRALVFRVELDQSGRSLASSFGHARIRSRAKLSYEEVQRYLDGAVPAANGIAAAPYAHSLELLRTVGRLRLRGAAQRDVVQYDRREIHVELPVADARTLRLSERKRLPVEDWNAQLSLLCNVEGAKFLAAAKDPKLAIEGVFRVHPPPSRQTIAAFSDWIESLVSTLGLEPGRWLWRRSGSDEMSLADYIEALPDDGEEARLSMAIQRQAMLLNQKAEFSVDPAVHHGIGAPYYSRFSSPMREVVGILTHHFAICQQQERPTGLSRVTVDEAIRIGNESKDLQKTITREVLKLAIDHLLEADLAAVQAGKTAPVRHGTVMGMTPTKLHVRLDDPPVDLKLYFDLIDQHAGAALRPDADGLRLYSPGRGGNAGPAVAEIGGRIGVNTAAYDERRGRWVLIPMLGASSSG